MTITQNSEPLTPNRLAAAALAALGAASAMPIPLAQTRFRRPLQRIQHRQRRLTAGAPRDRRRRRILTIAVLGLAFVGVGLALTGAPAARNVLIAAALAGFVTAMPLWVPAGVVIGAAAILLGQSVDRRPSSEHPRRNVLRTTSVDTHMPRQGQA